MANSQRLDFESIFPLSGQTPRFGLIDPHKRFGIALFTFPNSVKKISGHNFCHQADYKNQSLQIPPQTHHYKQQFWCAASETKSGRGPISRWQKNSLCFASKYFPLLYFFPFIKGNLSIFQFEERLSTSNLIMQPAGKCSLNGKHGAGCSSQLPLETGTSLENCSVKLELWSCLASEKAFPGPVLFFLSSLYAWCVCPLLFLQWVRARNRCIQVERL